MGLGCLAGRLVSHVHVTRAHWLQSSRGAAHLPATTCTCWPDSLHHLYGKNWAKALQIVDEGGVTCYVGQGSRRKVFQVG